MGIIGKKDPVIGITAGGQLGKMFALAAANWSIPVHVMDPDPNCPAGAVAPFFTRGDYKNEDDLFSFGLKTDILTFEIEHVSVNALYRLMNHGKKILPHPKTIEWIQDKGMQKQIFKRASIPTMPFILVESETEIIEKVRTGEISIPFVQKSRKMGYDGKGVKVVRSTEDLHQLLKGPCVVENLCEIHKELSVIVAGNEKGQIKVFPLIEMEFHPDANLVEFLICPANVDPVIAKQCEDIAVETFKAFDTIGLLAVEMFLDKNGNVYVNECAPRPHNSGHHTIEACITSQFEQHLRSILNFPLGDTSLINPSVMINLIGEPGHTGPVLYQNFRDIINIPGVYPHIYGKQETRPYRKMGHITIIDDTTEKAIAKARKVKQMIKVISC